MANAPRPVGSQVSVPACITVQIAPKLMITWSVR